MPPKTITNAANYCPACSLWHEPPVPCSHEPEAPCFEGCGRVRGFRWLGDDRKPATNARTCWHCWWTIEMGNPALPEMGRGIAT